MKITNGWLDSAEKYPSPNYNNRPPNEDINLLVIHNISLPPGQFGGPYIRQLFTNCLNPKDDAFFAEIASLQVSAHLLIDRQGRCTQFVPFHHRAWHAGISCWQGRENCNDFAVGIELEGTDNAAYEPVQYEVLAQVTAALLASYPALTQERIVGHSDVAPKRKTDPGPAFDWGRYRALIKVYSS